MEKVRFGVRNKMVDIYDKRLCVWDVLAISKVLNDKKNYPDGWDEDDLKKEVEKYLSDLE